MKLCTGDFHRHRLNDCECMTIHSTAIIAVGARNSLCTSVAMKPNQFIKAQSRVE